MTPTFLERTPVKGPSEAPTKADVIELSLLLPECQLEALENAAIAPHRLHGSQAGVFVGLSNADYERLAFAHRDGIDAYCATGTFRSTATKAPATNVAWSIRTRSPTSPIKAIPSRIFS